MTQWDPDQYERYKTYRDRPALDLMLRIPDDLEPRQIWDLGCGTGEHAAVLALRHPTAQVFGVDQSPDMLKVARGRTTARVTWIEGDVAAFSPPSPPDLIFTNAALQWLPDHEALFPRLVAHLSPGGVFACQLPISFEEAWHRHLRETAASGAWAEKLANVRGVLPTARPEDYYAWLSPLADVDIWSTTYLHILTGPDPVTEWMKGTGLRPYLERLTDPDAREAFLDAYRARTAKTFVRTETGETLFPFPRLFMIARRG